MSVDIKEPLAASSDLEHNYFHDDRIKIEEGEDVKLSVSDMSLLDHSYSLPYKDFKDPAQLDTVKNKKSDDSTQQYNNLIFGLDDSYRDDKGKAETDFCSNKVSICCFIF